MRVLRQLEHGGRDLIDGLANSSTQSQLEEATLQPLLLLPSSPSSSWPTVSEASVTHDDGDDGLSSASCSSSPPLRRARWAGLALLKMRQTTQSAAAPAPWELTWITDSGT